MTGELHPTVTIVHIPLTRSKLGQPTKILPPYVTAQYNYFVHVLISIAFEFKDSIYKIILRGGKKKEPERQSPEKLTVCSITLH